VDLSDWIDRHAGFAPAKDALRFEQEAITYRALAARVARAAGALRALQVRPGDRVAWLGLNSPHALALLFACARLGALLVPLNWRLAAPELGQVLGDCRPVALFAEARFVETIERIRAGLRDLRLVAVGGEAQDWLDGDALLRDSPPFAAGGGHGTGDAPAVICYTSGSTGAPKGVVLTQDALAWNAVNSTQMHDLTRADRILTTLPLFHVGGLCIQTLPALHMGATVILHPKFDPGATLAAIAAEAVTLTVLVPAQLDALAAHRAWPATDLSSLRAISTGSMIVPERNFRAVHARGVPLIQVYGSTETGPIATYIAIEDALRKAGSAGKPAVHCCVRVAGNDGADRPPGVSGEILVKGPNVMSGYWNAPAATAAALVDGWFHTGDIGHCDDEGFLWVDGRGKDMIISGGENIYPAEIENVLAESADIAEVAVVGRPDTKWGEVVVAVVVPASGRQLSDADVIALLDGRVARFKHPRDVVFAQELPRSALGKVRKDELRRMVRGEALAQGDGEGSRWR
jgi:fatty-acyl-CoA synthase